MRILSLEKHSSNLGRFAAAVSRDADELIGRTVLKATGDNFKDYIAKGGVPPLSLIFKAYSASASHHIKRAMEDGRPKNRGELLNPQDEVIGHTHYDRGL